MEHRAPKSLQNTDNKGHFKPMSTYNFKTWALIEINKTNVKVTDTKFLRNIEQEQEGIDRNKILRKEVLSSGFVNIEEK
jgi:hypothetical protein